VTLALEDRRLALDEELKPPLDGEEALLAADRCLECGTFYAEAPCVVACPASVDVPRFVTQLADGDRLGAAATIAEQNVLGATCARVCPSEVLCEGACVLVSRGMPAVEIARLQRYASDAGLAAKTPLRRVKSREPERVAVVGAGPAGLAAAAELAAEGFPVRLYDERQEVGGLVRYAIAPYRIQREPLPQEAAAIEALGVELHLGTRVDAELLHQLDAECAAIFLGIGLGDDTVSPYPGDELEGVWESLRFVEALKTGTLTRLLGDVVTIGGGNTAIDVAREALRLGADRSTLVYRRREEDMPAYPHEVEEAKDEGVELVFQHLPVRFVGSRHLEGVELQSVRLEDADGSGRPRPVPVAGSEFVLPCSTAVRAIGQQPRNAFLEAIDGLELRKGIVAIDEDGRTSNPRYYAGGDATNGGATAVQAVAHGKRAALAMAAAVRSAR
jgi:glutamate synthase (NADPH/NADH) small chain